jgi:hypothetical protein
MDRQECLSYDVNMKITRRKLALASLGSAVALGAAQAPPPPASPPEDPNAAAKEQVRKNSEALAKFDLPMSTEPAFQFKA